MRKTAVTFCATRRALGMAALGAGAAALTACAAVVGGSAVAVGMTAIDRRTTGSQVEDQGIELRAASRITAVLGERVHVNVTSYNRQVLLSGEVGSAADRQSAERLLREQPTVREVFNELVVAPFTSTLGERSKDTLLTTQVKASLINAKDLQATAFKVVTERRVVYLMGIVTPREAQRAAEIARGVNGVAKVVRLLEVISEADLARLRPPAAAAQPDADAPVGMQ